MAAARSVALLLMGAQRHYLWALWDDWRWQNGAWNICAALAILALLWLAAPRPLGYGVALWIVAWFAAEELLVVGCSIAQLLNPLPPDGSEQCTSHIGFKAGAVGLVVLAILAWKVTGVIRSWPKTD